MIIALLIFQILFVSVVVFNLSTITKIIFCFAMLLCIVIAQARLSALWAEVDLIKMILEKKRKNK